MDVVEAALYVGRGVRSMPIERGENSKDGERDNILKQICKVPRYLCRPSAELDLMSSKRWLNE